MKSSAPLRGTQSLVGQMGWVFARPVLTALEVLWRWSFGIPFVIAALFEAIKILGELSPGAAGLSNFDAQNPWVAAAQLSNAWALYQLRVTAVVHWLLPLAALAWVVASGLGRSLVLKRIILSGSEPGNQFSKIEQENTAGAKAQDSINGAGGATEVVPCYKAVRPSNSSVACFRPVAMMVQQAAWLALFALVWWSWLHSMQWVAATHITPNAEPDLIGYSIWAIFLSLGFFIVWALVSWPVAIAPLLMLAENRSAHSALGQSLRLGRPLTAKLIEINLVMGIVNMALIVLAMVLSAAPLPFIDQLGAPALQVVWAASLIFYFAASDYFQVVRLRVYLELLKYFRHPSTVGEIGE
jgi:hypothetical protein